MEEENNQLTSEIVVQRIEKKPRPGSVFLRGVFKETPILINLSAILAFHFSGANTMCLRDPASSRRERGRADLGARARRARALTSTSTAKKPRPAAVGAALGGSVQLAGLTPTRSPPRARSARKPGPARPSDRYSARLTRFTRWLYALVG